VTLFYLIRHGATDELDRVLSGRAPGVRLNAAGLRQAEALAGRLAGEAIRRLYSSPVGRARETAEPIARRLGLEVHTADELTELDCGGWTGRSFAELAADRRWQRFNTFRSGTRIPAGELIAEVQARAVAFLHRLGEEFPGDSVALVTHGDVIKAALAYWLGMPLDFILRLQVSPASVSAVALGEDGPSVLYVNRAEP